MDKVTQLFVRACKSSKGQVRVESVYKRFYGRYDHDTYCVDLVAILSGICDDFLNIKITTILDDLNPKNAWKHGINENDSYHAGSLKILISHIRLAQKDKFPGLSTPARFKRV